MWGENCLTHANFNIYFEGVASLPYFSDDDSAESSNAEDEEESEAGETEPDTEELAFLDEQLERRSSATGGASGGPRPNLAPQHMQWALRHREAPRGGPSVSTSSTTASGTASLRHTGRDIISILQ